MQFTQERTPPIVSVESVVEDSIRVQIREQLRGYEKHCMRMAKLLSQVKRQELYFEWGFPSFDEYVKADLGFEVRRAYYHIAIWKTFGEKFNIPENRIQQVGWVKAGYLASLDRVGVLTDENVEEWLERATEITTQELVAEIKEAKAKVETLDTSIIPTINPNTGPAVLETIERVSFHLYPGQQECVKKAFEVASRIAGSDKKGHLLETICLSFLSGDVSQLSNKRDEISWYIKRLEQHLNVKLIAFNNTDELLVSLRKAAENLEREKNGNGS